jgi:hypothetical protein
MAATAAGLALTLTACGSSTPGMDHATRPPTPSSASDMPGMHQGAVHDMEHGGMGDGLTAAEDGYTLTPTVTELPAGKDAAYTFRIAGPDGTPVTSFAVDQTKPMHFYAIRSDLTGFQHVHPTMAADGTWTADLAGLKPGTWRMYASFIPDSGAGAGNSLVLSRTVTVAGSAQDTPLPPATSTTQVDGYTVAIKGKPMAGMTDPMTVTLSKNGKPVTDLQPYLGTYAHLTAIHEGDQAFAHLHPKIKVNGETGGPDLAFHAMFPESGNWRLFLQFQTGGQVHTAALTWQIA